ncbi:DUF6941 family protein [Tumebacillus lipolyticus]|uniref:DUF6941 family protein n=1 Tax=Tumebacillus lipolyticus TaxID=1280370 RepID=A0ABW5A4H6_9BACL
MTSVNNVLFCHSVSLNENEDLNLLGVSDAFIVDEVPTTFPLYVYISFDHTNSESKDGSFTLEVDALYGSEGISVGAWPKKEFKASRTEIVLGEKEWPCDQLGYYIFRVKIDGEIVRTAKLFVIPSKELSIRMANNNEQGKE